MTTPASVTANLACVLHLLRESSEAREVQGEAFAVLRHALGGRALSVAVEAERLVVNGTTVGHSAPGAELVREHLVLHGVGELQVPPEVDDTTLMSILRALAAPGGTYRSLRDLLEEVRSGARGEFTLAPPKRERREESVFVELGADFGMATPPGLDAGEGAAAEGAHAAAAAVDDRPLDADALVARLQAEPAAPAAGEWLRQLVQHAANAADADRWEEVARTGAALARLEDLLGSDGPGRDIAFALRRMFPRRVLQQVAGLAVRGEQRRLVVPVLQRLGADATEVLLERLAEAESMDERRAYYDALRHMTEGTGIFISMLGHDEWFVVRNVADLCGDLKLEDAVPALARQVHHPDERVRRSVAGALAKIGTTPTVEPLRQALRDPAMPVRLQAVRALDGWRSRGLAMTLGVLLEEESHPELVREMLLALARIGTPEALQLLVRVAGTPGGRLFGRRRSNMPRVQAVEALGSVDHPMARNAIEGLRTDADPEVRAAAARTLGDTR